MSTSRTHLDLAPDVGGRIHRAPLPGGARGGGEGWDWVQEGPVRRYFSSLQALTLADAGAPERACETALMALPTAQRVGSRRTLQELGRLSDRLRPWRNRSVVRDTIQEITLATE
ncbi:hypothetical protein ABZ635_15455 [Nocardiopsis sp. NPDC007018]|uniref:hypothetical protein n=1 Tax=Nocardiopsis sp. NPDC007018 TaxID=3155721 RepID=UPI0033EAA61A